MPTFLPSLDNDTAKFTVVVDLPTPPFPEATARIFETPGIGFVFLIVN